jgi:hypothetical protein
MFEDPGLHATETGFKARFKSSVMGPEWVRQFNEKGLPGLEDQPRPGRKPTHKPEVWSALIALSTQEPRTLGYPHELWTLERLQQAFEQRQGVHLLTPPSGNGWQMKDWSGSGSRVGFTILKNTTPSSEKKEGIVAAYLTPPEPTRMICLGETEPIAVKT